MLTSLRRLIMYTRGNGVQSIVRLNYQQFARVDVSKSASALCDTHQGSVVCTVHKPMGTWTSMVYGQLHNRILCAPNSDGRNEPKMCLDSVNMCVKRYCTCCIAYRQQIHHPIFSSHQHVCEMNHLRNKQSSEMCVQRTNSYSSATSKETSYPFSRNKLLSLCVHNCMRTGHQCSDKVFQRMQGYGTTAGQETDDPLSSNSLQFRCYVNYLREEHQCIVDALQGGGPLPDSKQRVLRRRLLDLSPIVDKLAEFKWVTDELTEIEQLLKGPCESNQDKEMHQLASTEKNEITDKLNELDEEILDLMIPAEETDDNDIIMEFSAGVGGQEAMLFAADMFNMYQCYATYRQWRFSVLEYITTDLGGLRHATASISGNQAFRTMRHEAGVHRVQRVPKTERQGRIHTSTMTIAVLPQPKEIDLKLDPKDLRIETKRASGAGGQHVNTTDSAVRITHIPTGVAAESQQERSQQKNRAIAMVMLQTRIYNRILEEQTSSERSMRQRQVGTSARSEKIRTYNFPQDRITDHRISRSVYNMEEYLSGGELLDEMILTTVEEDGKEELRERILEVYRKQQSN